MTPDTANKVVAFFALGGTAAALSFSNNASERYRKTWGVVLLSIAGAALADFAPQLVGPFFGLVIVAYIAGHSKQIGSAVSSFQSQAGVKK